MHQVKRSSDCPDSSPANLADRWWYKSGWSANAGRWRVSESQQIRPISNIFGGAAAPTETKLCVYMIKLVKQRNATLQNVVRVARDNTASNMRGLAQCRVNLGRESRIEEWTRRQTNGSCCQLVLAIEPGGGCKDPKAPR